MRSLALGLLSYTVYAVVVGVLFTRVASGLLANLPTGAPSDLASHPPVETVKAGADRREVHPGSAPITVRISTVLDSGEFVVECHTTHDYTSADEIRVGSGEIPELYRALNCQ